MIPEKIFGRMLDLLIQSRDDREAQMELDQFQDQTGWPWHASSEQVKRWNDLYAQLDPNVKESVDRWQSKRKLSGQTTP